MRVILLAITLTFAGLGAESAATQSSSDLRLVLESSRPVGLLLHQVQPPAQIDVDIDTEDEAWYTSPVWIAIGVLALIVLILVIAMAVRGGGGGGTTVVRD